MTDDRCVEEHDLSLLLESRLGSGDETAVTRHLDRCEDCRRRLETLAADTTEWQAMRDLLRSPEPAAGNEFDRRHPDHEWATDNAVPLSFLAPSDDPASLGRMGPYEVTGVIGRGGMSVVLKAFDRPLNRYVAVKVLAPQLAASAAARRRFEREAQAAAAVVHEHAIAIHAVAEFNGLPYLVMPYFPGRSLQRRIDETGPLRLPELLRIGKQVAAGLAAAHAQGLVHRDVKPANILLENGVERAVVTDFGLARAIDDATVTCSGVISGTPQYMAPEQARGEPADRRADLFSLGSVIYAMCTGRPPFRAETTLGVLRRVCDEQPHPIRELNPEVPAWLAAVVSRLHAKDPADRFQNAREVAELLERGLAHVQNPVALPDPPHVPASADGERTRRNRRRVVAITVCSVLIFSAGATWLQIRPPGDAVPSYPESRTRPAAEPSSASIPDGTPEVDSILRQRAEELASAWFVVPDGDGDPWRRRIQQTRAATQRLEAEMRRGGL